MKTKTGEAEEATEKAVYFVIPSEARNLSSMKVQKKRDFSARNVPRFPVDAPVNGMTKCELFHTP